MYQLFSLREKWLNLNNVSSWNAISMMFFIWLSKFRSELIAPRFLAWSFGLKARVFILGRTFLWCKTGRILGVACHPFSPAPSFLTVLHLVFYLSCTVCCRPPSILPVLQPVFCFAPSVLSFSQSFTCPAPIYLDCPAPIYPDCI